MNRTRSEFALDMFLAPLTWALCFASLDSTQAQNVPTLDASFKPVVTPSGGFGSALAVQPDGKIIWAGAFNAINGVAENGLARLNPDGSIDVGFNTGAVCCGAAIGQTSVSSAIT